METIDGGVKSMWLELVLGEPIWDGNRKASDFKGYENLLF